jgi:hypothetical protein
VDCAQLHHSRRVPAESLSPASPDDLADALAFALRFEGRKHVHNADEIMSSIVAKRLVEHLERSGLVLMKKLPIGGRAALGRGLREEKRNTAALKLCPKLADLICNVVRTD